MSNRIDVYVESCADCPFNALAVASPRDGEQVMVCVCPQGGDGRQLEYQGGLAIPPPPTWCPLLENEVRINFTGRRPS